MTREQVAEAKLLVGKMPREEIAQTVGVSLANLKRSMRGVRLNYYNHLRARPDLVKEVCKYYEKHGRRETEKRYPKLKIRSIVERYKDYKPRQIRWTDEQICELVKMGGIISYRHQWRFFKRPNAYEGSTKSFWMKRMSFSGGGIHGLSHWIAKEITTGDCPYICTEFWETRDRRYISDRFSRKLYLWVDMENHLKLGIPKFIEDAVVIMAEFQRWVFQSKSPKKEIEKMIRERQVKK